jgi:phage-related protein
MCVWIPSSGVVMAEVVVCLGLAVSSVVANLPTTLSVIPHVRAVWFALRREVLAAAEDATGQVARTVEEIAACLDTCIDGISEIITS